MKNPLRPFLATLFPAFLVFSCQPGPVEEPPADPPAKGDLQMYYVLDTLYPSGQDTVVKYTYTYDGNKRIEEMLMQEYDAGDLVPELLYWQKEKHIYNGADNLPSKVIKISREYPTPQFFDTAFLSYANGRVIRDSSVSYRDQSMLYKLVYEYPSGQSANRSAILVKNYITNPSFFYVDTIVSTYTVQAGNLMNAFDTIKGQMGDFRAFNYQFEFDTKTNPLAGTVLPVSNPWFFNNTPYVYSLNRARQNPNNITVMHYDVDDLYPVSSLFKLSSEPGIK